MPGAPVGILPDDGHFLKSVFLDEGSDVEIDHPAVGRAGPEDPFIALLRDVVMPGFADDEGDLVAVGHFDLRQGGRGVALPDDDRNLLPGSQSLQGGSRLFGDPAGVFEDHLKGFPHHPALGVDVVQGDGNPFFKGFPGGRGRTGPGPDHADLSRIRSPCPGPHYQESKNHPQSKETFHLHTSPVRIFDSRS